MPTHLDSERDERSRRSGAVFAAGGAGLQPPRVTMSSQPSAIVVGGSLAGLMAALSVARTGMHVRVLERSADTGRTGAMLQAPPRLIERLTGRARASWMLPAGIQTWHGVHGILRSAAEADPNIEITDGVTVTQAGQNDDQAWATCSDGQTIFGDILVGADGHRSVVRHAVAPDRPDARFAGYLIWIGIAEESGISATGRWPRDVEMMHSLGDIMFGGPMPGTADLPPGQRRLAWAWYDASRNDILRRTGALVGNRVEHSLRGSDMSEAELESLDRSAAERWSPIWHQAIRDCIRRRSIIGTPIAEYVPDRLVNGRLALVGDAAHVPTPMTGNGFGASLNDAEAIGNQLEHHSDVADALKAYERERLPSARSLVLAGQDFSRSFARGAA